MAVVSETYVQRWASRNHVGEATPQQRVFVRLGRFYRGYKRWEESAEIGDAVIPDQPKGRPWQATWTPKGDWVELPNVSQVQLEKDFDQQGAQTVTIEVDNTVLAEKQGFGGIYHVIERGYFSPWRGYASPRLRNVGHYDRTPWYQLLSGSCQLRIEQSYGEDPDPAYVFTGLVDDVDLDSAPDSLTITGRCFGQVLTDERLFGWVKDSSIKDPVIFADRLGADDVKAVGGGAEASSERPGHPARFVVDDSSSSDWLSSDHTTADYTEWVQVRLPAGRYETIRLRCAYAGMHAYVGIYAHDRLVLDGEVQHDSGGGAYEGWVHAGNGNVPGANGGWAFVTEIANTTTSEVSINLGHQIIVGDNSILRVGFRDLKRITASTFRAGVTRLQGVRRIQRAEVKQAKWILVDDLSDVVRVVCRWAGFKEWEIEDTGVRLKGKSTWSRSSFLIDPIKDACDKTGFIFFVGDPSSEESIGVPTFRYTRATADQPQVPLVTDADLLTGVQSKFTKEPLAYIIRVRGKTVESGGQHLGGDKSNRLMQEYRPPWSKEPGDGKLDRLGGVLKHVTHTDNALKTREECLVKCFFIALAEALASATAIIEIPGHAGFDLDEHIAMQDRGTGFSTRLWISNRSITYSRSDRETSYTTQLGGALIDTPDITAIRSAIRTQMPDPRDNGRGRSYANTAQGEGTIAA